MRTSRYLLAVLAGYVIGRVTARRVPPIAGRDGDPYDDVTGDVDDVDDVLPRNYSHGYVPSFPVSP